MLNIEVSKEFELVNWTGGHRQFFGAKFGIIDLKQINLQQASRLVQMGFPKLKKKAAQKSAAK